MVRAGGLEPPRAETHDLVKPPFWLAAYARPRVCQFHHARVVLLYRRGCPGRNTRYVCRCRCRMLLAFRGRSHRMLIATLSRAVRRWIAYGSRSSWCHAPVRGTAKALFTNLATQHLAFSLGAFPGAARDANIQRGHPDRVRWRGRAHLPAAPGGPAAPRVRRRPCSSRDQRTTTDILAWASRLGPTVISTSWSSAVKKSMSRATEKLPERFRIKADT